MDDSDELKAENKQLRQLLDELRAREVDDLRLQLAESRQLVEHYKAEAHRNADVGRKIAADYQVQVAELRAKLEAFQQVQASARRNLRNAGSG